MASDSINHYDYYNHNVEPNATVNPNKKGPLWNANDSKQINCCVDNSINKNVWKRLNPDINDFDKRLDDIEKEIDKPEFKLPVNGYKSQIVARYFAIDGDDGNGTGIRLGNAGFMLSPHYYPETAGGDEYGMVALRVRDIGYLGTITRYKTHTNFNDVPSSVTMVNGETIELVCTNTHSWIYDVKGLEDGARLPIWPMVPNFAVNKIKFYHIPSNDERAAPYLGTRYGSYKDLLYSIPFPYDRYDQCRVTEYNVPTGEVVGWKSVSVEEYNRHWDMRKYVDSYSNTYYIPITSGSKPYNYTDRGVGMQIWAGNGYHRTFADLYYEGEFISPKKMNDKSNKEYAVSLFYAYTGHTAYKNNSPNNGIGVTNRIRRTLYNAYGFCLYTIQEFYDTNNRYPNLMEGTPDYTWCIDYLRSKLNNIHRRINSTDLYCNTGDLYVYINDDGKYVIQNGDACSNFDIMYVSQPTKNINERNFRI